MSDAGKATAKKHALTALVSALLGYTAQGVQTAVAIRDELRDLRRDVADVKCDVAILTKSQKLPAGCFVVMPAGGVAGGGGAKP